MTDAPFRKLEERLIHEGAVVAMYNIDFESPDGVVIERDVVRHPGAVSVVALASDGTVTLVRQFRAAIEGYTLEIPAGKRDVDGEPPEDTARRELAEEVGLAAERFEKLIELRHSPGFCDEVNHIYLATGLSEVPAETDGVEEEHMTVMTVPLSAVFDMIAAGELTDAKSVVGLTLAAQRMGVGFGS